MALCPYRFWRQAKLIAERPGEGFMRGVTGIECHREDIRSTRSKAPRRVAQTPTAHITHNRSAGRNTKCAQQIVTRDTGATRNVAKRQLLAKLCLNEPQRFSDRVRHSRHTYTQPGAFA